MKISDIFRQVADAIDQAEDPGTPDPQLQNPGRLSPTAGGVAIAAPKNQDAGAAATFTLDNTAIANTDVMIINQVSVGNIGDYAFSPICNNGNAAITVRNLSNQNRSDAIVMRFAVVRGAVA
jgi:hypothetical protein